MAATVAVPEGAKWLGDRQWTVLLAVAQHPTEPAPRRPHRLEVVRRLVEKGLLWTTDNGDWLFLTNEGREVVDYYWAGRQ